MPHRHRRAHRHPAALVALWAATTLSPLAAQAADAYRFTAHLVGLYGGAPSISSSLMQLTESGIVYGVQIEGNGVGGSRYVAYEWRNGVNQRLFESPWVVGGGANQTVAISETGIFVGVDWARQGDKVQALGSLPDTAGPQTATVVNASGRIVGNRTIIDPVLGRQQQTPTAWQFGGAGSTADASNLAFATTYRTSSGVLVRDINAGGTAAGLSSVTQTILRATVWQTDGSAALLPSLSTDPLSGQALLSDAVDISNSGWVAGYADLMAGNGLYVGNRAVRWGADGSLQNLGTLSTTATGVGLSRATAINERGDVAGTFVQYASNGSQQGARAFLWDATTQSMRSLGTLGSSATGVAAAAVVDLNDLGQAVGASDLWELRGVNPANRGNRATFADTGGQFVNLNTLTDPASLARPGVNATAVLKSASEINNRGWILTTAQTGETYLLVPTGDALAPIPEPRAAGLLALGLALVGWRLRHRPAS